MLPTLETARRLAGWGILAMSVLLYEHQEKKLDAVLKRLWASVDGLKKGGIPTRTAIVRGSAKATRVAIDATFGPRLLSARAFWTSAWFSLAALGATLLVVVHVLPTSPEQIAALNKGTKLRVNIESCVAIGLLPRIHPRYAGLVLWALLLSWLSWTWEHADPILFGFATLLMFYTSCFVIASVASDLATLAILRWVLRWLDRQRSLGRILLALFVGGILAVALIFGPVAAMVTMLAKLGPGPLKQAPMADQLWGVGWTLVPAMVSMSNTFTAVFVVFFCAVLLVASLYRPVFTVLERPLYALQRFGLFGNRKLIASIGILLIAGPRVAEWIRALRF